VVVDVPGFESRPAFVGRRMMVVMARRVRRRITDVDVVQVQTPHLVMVVGRLVDVRSPGHHAER
jgi:hypothetical protein